MNRIENELKETKKGDRKIIALKKLKKKNKEKI